MIVKNIAKLSIGEETLVAHLRAYQIPFEREFQFHAVRKWRVDFLIGKNIAVEVEGGGSNGMVGRHQSRQGFQNDCVKYNRLAIMGYTLLRYTTADVKNGIAIAEIQEALARGAA